MLKAFWCTVLALGFSLQSWADVGFKGAKFYIGVEIKLVDPKVYSPDDSFIFEIRAKKREPHTLRINKIAVTRARLEKEFEKRLDALEKTEDSEKSRREEKLLREIERLLADSFSSEFMILEFSEKLAAVLRSLDEKNTIPNSEIHKMLEMPISVAP
jgi:hypothetical protein